MGGIKNHNIFIMFEFETHMFLYVETYSVYIPFYIIRMDIMSFVVVVETHKKKIIFKVKKTKLLSIIHPPMYVGRYVK